MIDPTTAITIAIAFAAAFIVTLVWALKMRRSMKYYYDVYVDEYDSPFFTSEDELARKIGFLCEKVRLMEEGRRERQQ